MPTGGIECIPLPENARWESVLQQAEQWDVYHSPQYHLLSAEAGEGDGVLFVYREGEAMAAWPLLLRPAGNVEGLEEAGAGYLDATSVYGYPGPVWNAAARMRPDFFSHFQFSLEDALRARNVVCMFSRTHPIFGVAPLTGSTAQLECKGQTVSIDLSLESQQQTAQYRTNHQSGIHRAQHLGYAAYRDERKEHLDDFIGLYTSTMERSKASPEYYFSREFFTRMAATLGPMMHLFVAGNGGRVCSAALFLCRGTVIHYHLGGSNHEGMEHSLSKLVIDEARAWGTGIGAHWLHLGGGRGVQEDSLFHFKAGFSHVRHDFYVWKNVLLPAAYDRLVEAHTRFLAGSGKHLIDRAFFPLYRSSTTPGDETPPCDTCGTPGVGSEA